jgi:plasmid stability protein
MKRMVQIRNVPDALHRELKARAALAGQSLSEYLLGILDRATERATPQEMRARLGERTAVELSKSPADAVRAEREARDSA